MTREPCPNRSIPLQGGANVVGRAICASHAWSPTTVSLSFLSLHKSRGLRLWRGSHSHAASRVHGYTRLRLDTSMMARSSPCSNKSPGRAPVPILTCVEISPSCIRVTRVPMLAPSTLASASRQADRCWATLVSSNRVDSLLEIFDSIDHVQGLFPTSPSRLASALAVARCRIRCCALPPPPPG